MNHQESTLNKNSSCSLDQWPFATSDILVDCTGLFFIKIVQLTSYNIRYFSEQGQLKYMRATISLSWEM